MISDTLKEIIADVKDIAGTEFDYSGTPYVPKDSDTGLSYEGGKKKWGKEITSCVLYVDIRNSVGLTATHHAKTMGKLYTAFTKGVIKVARYFDGHTRNIIGDRVMIVFPEKNCFTNSVSCALAIHNVAKIIAAQFSAVDFKCGIGIDHGTMRVIKVGVPRRGQEANPNRGLVWAGKPANLASRLTDMGNKTVEKVVFDLEFKVLSPLFPRTGLTTPQRKHTLFEYIQEFNAQKKATVSEASFVKNVSMEAGETTYQGRKLIAFSRRVIPHTYKPILITERVYTGLAREAKVPALLKTGWWPVDTNIVKDVDVTVRGGDYYWTIK